jgi:hypothetical protein
MLDLSELVSEKTRRRRIVNDYLDMHHITPVLNSTVKHYLRDYQDVKKHKQNEDIVLTILPKHIQTQLLCEVRAPVLLAHPLFSSLNQEFQSAMRYVCRRVVKVVSAVKHEVVFEKGDSCSRMLFMDKVCGKYGTPYEEQTADDSTPTTALQNVFDPSPKASSHYQKSASLISQCIKPFLKQAGTGRLTSIDGSKVSPGTWLSEPALWVEWANRGRLVAGNHGSMYGIDANDLSEGFRYHIDAFAMVVLYATAFVDEIQQGDCPTDIPEFAVDISEFCPIRLKVSVNAAHALCNVGGFLRGKSDPYCLCKVQDASRYRTKTRFATPTVYDCLDPVWNHTAFINISQGQSVLFEVWDSEIGNDQLLGEVCLEPDCFMPDGFQGKLDLAGGLGNGVGSVSVKIMVCEVDSAA